MNKTKILLGLVILVAATSTIILSVFPKINENEIPVADDKQTNTEIPDFVIELAPLVWESKLLNLSPVKLPVGEVDISFGLEIPEGWELKLEEEPYESIYYTNGKEAINETECYTILVNDPDKLISIIIEQYCGGWSGNDSLVAYSTQWTEVSRISRKEQGPPGYGHELLYRSQIVDNSLSYYYGYTPGSTDEEPLPIGVTSSIFSELLIGFPPPNESTYDFFFIVVNASVEIENVSDKDLETLLHAADRIVSSLHLI